MAEEKWVAGRLYAQGFSVTIAPRQPGLASWVAPHACRPRRFSLPEALRDVVTIHQVVIANVPLLAMPVPARTLCAFDPEHFRRHSPIVRAGSLIDVHMSHKQDDALTVVCGWIVATVEEEPAAVVTDQETFMADLLAQENEAMGREFPDPSP